IGLLGGFGGLAALVVSMSAAAGFIAATTGRARTMILCAFAFAGALSATAATSSARRCATTAAVNSTILVRVGGDAEAGGFTRGTVADCGAPVSVFVADGHASAGATIAVNGLKSLAPDSGAVIIQAASIRQIATPPWTARLRSASERQTDSAFRDDAPLVRALVLADMEGMSPEIRDRWAAAGLAHMLSVSGLH